MRTVLSFDRSVPILHAKRDRTDRMLKDRSVRILEGRTVRSFDRSVPILHAKRDRAELLIVAFAYPYLCERYDL
jgi:hypothetical protein